MEVQKSSGVDLAQKDVIARPIGRFGHHHQDEFGNNTELRLQYSCRDETLPDIRSYFTAIDFYGIILCTLGALAVLSLLFLYLDTLRYVVKNTTSNIKAHTAFIISVYPVVGMATYCAIVVPRAQLLAEAVAQGMFMFSMYQLFCLILGYCGGEAEMIRRVKPDSLNPRVAPCCCWPCCCILPLLAVNKRNVLFLRMLVLQLPVVQGMVYMILLVMWAEEKSLSQVNYLYVQPFIVVSIFLGIWGMFMCMKMLNEILSEYSLRKKFIVLQLVLIFSKLQGLLMKIIVNNEVLPCNPPITPNVYANLIFNITMLVEMNILGLWARSLYKKPLPEAFLNNGNVEQVCVIPTVHAAVEKQMDGNTTNTNKQNNNAQGYTNNNFVDAKL